MKQKRHDFSLIVAGVFLVVMCWGGMASASIEDHPNGRHNVKIYSASWCSYCASAKAFFNQQNIEYREYDIEDSDEAYRQYQALNGSGLPLIVINNHVIHGFFRDQILSALQ